MKNYRNNYQDELGNAIVGGEITIYNSDHVTLATLYSDNAGTATTNPVITDTTGTFEFYVADGWYRLVATSTEVSTVYIEDMQIVDDIGGGLVSVNLTAQAAAIAATTLATPTSTGFYTVTGYAVTSVVGTGVVSTVLKWTDAVQSQQTNLLGDFDMSVTGSFAAWTQPIRAIVGVPITYETTITGLGGGAKYDLHIKFEPA